jgi:hypothetical protein
MEELGLGRLDGRQQLMIDDGPQIREGAADRSQPTCRPTAKGGRAQASDGLLPGAAAGAAMTGAPLRPTVAATAAAAAINRVDRVRIEASVRIGVITVIVARGMPGRRASS